MSILPKAQAPTVAAAHPGERNDQAITKTPHPSTPWRTGRATRFPVRKPIRKPTTPARKPRLRKYQGLATQPPRMAGLSHLVPPSRAEYLLLPCDAFWP